MCKPLRTIIRRTPFAGKGFFAMSFIRVQDLSKRFYVRKKREKGALFREKETVEALKGVSFDIG